MATSTPTRRVLKALDVNKATPKRAGTPFRQLSSPKKLCNVAEAALLQISFPKNSDKDMEADDRVGKSKRGCLLDDGSEGSPKRRKRDTAAQEEGLSLSGGILDHEGDVLFREESLRRDLSSPQRQRNSLSRASSPWASPSSSFDISKNDMNDTQDTILTEPDLEPILAARPPTIVLTLNELREKARAMKLRLSLASYKVRTNQVDVPMSRLEIRTSSATRYQRRPSLSRPSSGKSGKSGRSVLFERRLLPGSPSRLSDRREADSTVLQLPSKSLTSSPPTVNRERNLLLSPVKQGGAQREAFNTPVLPRHISEFPQLSPTHSATGGLTSSVVKGRAADGLLSLMRQD